MQPESETRTPQMPFPLPLVQMLALRLDRFQGARSSPRDSGPADEVLSRSISEGIASCHQVAEEDLISSL